MRDGEQMQPPQPIYGSETCVSGPFLLGVVKFVELLYSPVYSGQLRAFSGYVFPFLTLPCTASLLAGFGRSGKVSFPAKTATDRLSSCWQPAMLLATWDARVVNTPLLGSRVAESSARGIRYEYEKTSQLDWAVSRPGYENGKGVGGGHGGALAHE